MVVACDLGSFCDPGKSVNNDGSFLMLSPFRLAGIISVLFAVCSSVNAQQIAPAGSGVTIDKMVIENGFSHTVRYFVTGGSPQLQALVRRMEWAENELSVIEQLQMLKLDTVVNERRVSAFRTSQLTNPYYAPGFIPISSSTEIGSGKGSLQRALTRQLAHEAAPEAALQLIGYLEQVQTELDVLLKALPPQEKKAAQEPVDALRSRLAALSRSESQPVVTPPTLTRQVTAPQPSMPLNPVTSKQIEVEWGQSWWPAQIQQVEGDRFLIHYTGFDTSWDEWVTKDRIRPRRQEPKRT
jgi:hypothetical protein